MRDLLGGGYDRPGHERFLKLQSLLHTLPTFLAQQ
jgi:hypothetical protein